MRTNIEFLKDKKRIHFVGIGGIGMSGLAQLLIESGFKVSGSDIKKTGLLRKLQTMGVDIQTGHRIANVEGADLVIYSSSIRPDNPELNTAKEKKIPILARGRLLAELMNKEKGIAISGSHGKSTTSSLLSFILEKSGLDATFAIGAENSLLGGNAYSGKGEYFVAEADESDGSFLYLKPFYSIITNIEEEHMDYYRNLDNIIETYTKFIQGVKRGGCLFACRDGENVKRIINNYQGEVITYGLDELSDIYATNIKIEGFSSKFDCIYKGNYIDSFLLSIPGVHNIVNSLGVIAVCLKMGIDKKIIKETMRLYKGAKRRFQVKGVIKGVTIIEDYAHHPTEIEVTLKSAYALRPKRLIVVFQPHRYSRTKYFKESFSSSLAKADYLILTDIYSASEEKIEGVSSEIIYDLILKSGHRATYLLNRKDIVERLLKILEPKDIVLILGAGDIGEVSDELVRKLKK